MYRSLTTIEAQAVNWLESEISFRLHEPVVNTADMFCGIVGRVP